MQNTFLAQLIKSFSQTEIKEVYSYLESPFFNQRKDLQVLFRYLAECLHDLNIEPSREQVFNKVFPQECFDDQKLRLHSSYLMRQLERYLLVKECLHTPLQTNHLLLRAYRKKDLQKHMRKTFRKQQQQIEQQAFRNAEYHQAAFWQEQELYQMESQAGRSRAHNLQVLENHLHYSFLSMKLRQACLLIAHQAVYKTDYESEMIDAVIEHANRPDYDAIPAISVYYYCYKMLANPDDDASFYPFKEKLFRNINHFPKAEMRDLFLMALNFCIRKINDNRPYFKEALELYRKGLENKILLENGHLSRFTYTNIVGVALRLQETKWVAEFIKSYRPFLEPAWQEATYSLCAARLEYTRKNYDKALLYLQKADYRDFINNMVAKIIQLKIYFELNEIDLLESHLKTMRGFIGRNKRLGYHQRNYRNIITMTQRLIRMNPFDKQAKERLKQRIVAAEPLTEKGWLLERLEGV